MHGLVNITNVMNQHTKGVGASAGLIVLIVSHNCLIGIAILIIGLVRQPVNNAGDML